MSNSITQSVIGPQNDVAPDGRAGTAQVAPARGAPHSPGSRLWSRASFSAATAGRAFGHHNPMARAYSDVSTQL